MRQVLTVLIALVAAVAIEVRLAAQHVVPAPAPMSLGVDPRSREQLADPKKPGFPPG